MTNRSPWPIFVGCTFKQIASCTASPLPFVFQHSHIPRLPPPPLSPYPPSHAICPWFTRSTSSFTTFPQPCKRSVARSTQHLPPLLHRNSCRSAHPYFIHTNCQFQFLTLNFTNTSKSGHPLAASFQYSLFVFHAISFNTCFTSFINNPLKASVS